MQKLRHTLLLGILALAKISFAQPADVIREYIIKYKDIAIEEMKRTGVPAAVTLAQGVHETAAGQSALVLKSNNHFGIKCKSTWTGESVRHDDDAPKECFRKYDSPIDSYRDHSDFLRNGSRYAFLFNLEPTDFEGWCWGLKKAGYATNPKYPQVLIKLIRDYELYDYTLIAMGRKTEGPDVYWAKAEAPEVKTVFADSKVSVPPPVVESSTATVAKTEVKRTLYPSGVFKINDTKVVFVPAGTSFLTIANEYRVPLRRLFDFNDMEPQEIAETDQLLYLQRKRKNGLNERHTVLEGESLYDIAQVEAIRLASLLEYNYLKAEMQPQAGEVLYLRSKAPGMPRLKLAASAAVVTVVNSISTNMAQAEGQESAYLVHVVQPKETLYSISRKYTVSIADVLKWNNLPSDQINIGQQLRIKKM